MHDNIEKIATSTPDLALERQARLRELFPEAWSEGELDFSKLRTLLGDLSDESAERYRFGWAGKRESLQLLQTPSRATLRPARDESIDFSTTQNLFIEGDNLEALKLLYKPLFNRVKMIYIDPPYNTGNDFIYPDNLSDPLKNYLIQTGQKDPNGDLQTSTPDVAGRVHSRWLSMLYPRLTLARSLLRDDGVIFVSIDDNEVHHLRLLMNEVFGEENFVGNLIYKRRSNVDSRTKDGLSLDHEFALIYRRTENGRLRGGAKDMTKYANPDDDERGPWASDNLAGLASIEQRPNLHYTLINPATELEYPCTNSGWRYSRETMGRLIEEEKILWPSSPAGRPRLKRFQAELQEEFTGFSSLISAPNSADATREFKELFDGADVFDFPKSVSYLKLLIEQGTENNDIILDFFAGSGTTAQAVLELNREDGGNRRFVLVQLPETTGIAQFPTIADIGKERIRRVIGRMIGRMKEQPLLDTRETPEDLGFKVWKLGESHFRQFQPPSPEDEGYAAAYIEQLELMNDALLPGFVDESVLYEVALREGFGLNCSLEPVPDLEGVSVWRVSDAERGQHFFATLDASLELESLRPLKLSPDDLFICRGIALDDDTAANLALQCRLKMI